MKAEVEKNLYIYTKLKTISNEWFYFEKYVISANILMPPEKDKISERNINIIELNFYNIKTFKKEFTIKNEVEEFPSYSYFKLFYSKGKTLYLLGYTTHIAHIFKNDFIYPSKLVIFELRINEKKLEKKAVFTNYVNFIDDLKDDKLYLLSSNKIMVYDFSKNFIKEGKNNYLGEFNKLILVDDYILVIAMNLYVTKYNYSLFASIYDKNLKPLSSRNNNIIKLTDYFTFNHNTIDFFIPISDNFFVIDTDCVEDEPTINIAEIRIKGNEDLLKSYNNNDEEEETKNGKELIDDVYKMHEITIKERINCYPYFIPYPLGDDLLGIVGKDIYIYNIANSKMIIKFNLSINGFDLNLSIIKYEDKNEKCKLYLGNKYNMIFLSS